MFKKTVVRKSAHGQVLKNTDKPRNYNKVELSGKKQNITKNTH